MAAAVEVFKRGMLRSQQLTAEQAILKPDAATARKLAMAGTADGFEAKVGGLAATALRRCFARQPCRRC